MRISSHRKYSAYLQSKTKRFMDIFLVLLVLLPCLFLTVLLSLLIVIVEGRPIFFKQARAGRYGDFIQVVKLRTLKKESDPCTLSPRNGSRRIHKIGSLLRKHKLDEIPQLISVLKGEMSIVGPRPELECLISEYKIKDLVYRLNARPGLTGLWQIKADTSLPIYENIKYDLYYIRKASLMLDLKLIMATLVFVFKNRTV